MRSLSDGLHHAAVGAATPDGGPVTVTNLTLSNKPLGNRMSAKKAGCPSGLRGRIANPFVVGSNPTPAFIRITNIHADFLVFAMLFFARHLVGFQFV